MATASCQYTRPAMKPAAPPWSPDVATASRNVGNGMPADSMAHGTVTALATAAQPRARTGRLGHQRTPGAWATSAATRATSTPPASSCSHDADATAIA